MFDVEGVPVAQFWYCLVHKKVEGEEGCPNSERLGPFDTRAEAENAIELAHERNEQWDRNEDEWNGRPPRST